MGAFALGDAESGVPEMDASDGGIDDGAPDVSSDARANPPESAPPPRVPKIHRSTASSCMQPRSGGSDAGVYCGFFGGEVGGDAGACQYDTDCTAGMSGRCVCNAFLPVTGSVTSCSYDACQSDLDCANGSSGGVCDCREGPLGSGNQSAANVCLAGNCRTDADCGSGGYCSPSNVPGCGPDWWYGYFCHTANDTCTNDTDCPGPNGLCATYGNAWHCYPSPCADGGV
jgi:hypothetical protein